MRRVTHVQQSSGINSNPPGNVLLQLLLLASVAVIEDAEALMHIVVPAIADRIIPHDGASGSPLASFDIVLSILSAVGVSLVTIRIFVELRTCHSCQFLLHKTAAWLHIRFWWYFLDFPVSGPRSS